MRLNKQLYVATETSSNTCSLCQIVHAVQHPHSQSHRSAILAVAVRTLSPPWCYLFIILLTSQCYSYADSKSAVVLFAHLAVHYVCHVAVTIFQCTCKYMTLVNLVV